MVVLYQLIDISVEFEKLLADEIFNELIIVYNLLVINLGPAFQLHFLWIILPLNVVLHQRIADQLEHFMRVSLEFYTNMEGPCLILLNN